MARAPGGKAGVDAPSEQRDPARLVGFSDAGLRDHDHAARPRDQAADRLREPAARPRRALWPSYLAYAVTFLFIGQVWANHHVMFDYIRAADRVVLLLNTLLLMVVAFLPFATSALAGALRSGHGQRTAAVLYGIAFDVTALTFNAVWQ